MPLFQISVLNKYLAEQDKQVLEDQYSLFKSYFLNSTIQKNILASKEEEFQEGFLRELFVRIFGYTINPDENYNLKTELKNVKDSKKADGAIVDNEKVLAIIELKGTDTVNLNQIEIQAFGYKNNQDGCKYVITSNFQKIRFYIDNAIEFLEWDLFKLDFENFKLLYLCLSKENIFKNLAAIIKAESITVEENVTKQLYKEYSGFRKALFNNIVELNTTFDKLLLFKKTQKLLDRFLFLFFAEDKMLVPPNSVRKILEQWNSLKDMDAYQPLYGRFKLYFGYLNVGHQGKLHDIFAYNGGLFAPDEVLDNILIDDIILYKATLSLSNYNYNSEVDVNILGHIFEHSLTEIEELENEIINNETLDLKKSKRKKDGVFYTPKYITKFIVENTVGTLCKNKKVELKIEDADYHPLQKKKTVKILLSNLHIYREWLLQITIIDPACGSGAFLIQALEFLIAEHKYISELEANITGSSIVFDVENSILENNLFGVDINEESVEIAKLSLWLRTAKKGRKLNSLNNNIKCGNSLIDDIAVAGDKVFIWEKEFPQVFGEYTQPINTDKKELASRKVGSENETENYSFTAYKESESSNIKGEKITNQDDKIVNTDFNIVNEKEVEFITEKKANSGFDVVIGNPPYVQLQSMKEISLQIKELGYKTFEATGDLYCLFYEKGHQILKQQGVLGYITSNKWMRANYGKSLRNYFLENVNPYLLIELGAGIFESAVVDSNILLFKKEKVKTIYINCLDLINEQIVNDFSIFENKFQLYSPKKDENWVLKNPLENTILQKIDQNGIELKNWKLNIFRGILTGFNEAFIIEEDTKNTIVKEDPKSKELIKPLLRGRDIQRFQPEYNNQYLITTFPALKLDIENYKGIKNYLFQFRKKLEQSGEKGSRKKTNNKWFETQDAIAYYEEFDKELIIWKRIGSILRFSLGRYYCLDSTCILSSSSNKYLLCVLNSRMGKYLMKDAPKTGTGDLLISVQAIEPLKIPQIKDESKFNILADKMLINFKLLIEANSHFQKLLSSKFENININTKLEKWYNLTFKDFGKELSKQKIKLTLVQESEWLSFFEQEKQKALSIKNEIDTTDAEIDRMVYSLYGLSEEEIKIVEGN